MRCMQGWWINSGSWGTDGHTLVLINTEFQPIVDHPVIGKVETGLNWGAQKLAVVADKEDLSIIGKEDSTICRKNTRQAIYKEREKSGTKRRLHNQDRMWNWTHK